jgi:PAS domain S-box-containing protein
MVEAITETVEVPVAPAATWPASLRGELRMVLASPVAMAIAWGAELRLLYNDSFRALLGDRHVRGPGAPAAELLPDAWGKLEPVLERARRGDRATAEAAVTVCAGSTWSLACSPIRDDASAVAGVLVVAVEAAGELRRQRDAALASAEAQRQLQYVLFEQVPAAIAVFRGDDLVFEMANQRYLEAARRRDLLGRRALDVFPQLRGRGFEQMIAVVRRTGEPCLVKEMEVDQRWWSFVLAPIANERGVVDRVMSFSYEITDLVVAQQHAEAAVAELQNTVSLLDAAFTGVPVGISVYDRELRLVQLNDTLARWNGFDREHVIGRRLGDLMPGDISDRISRRLRHVFATGAASETALVASTPTTPGAPRDCLVTYYPVRAASGEVVQVGVVVVDVSREPRDEAC